MSTQNKGAKRQNLEGYCNTPPSENPVNAESKDGLNITKIDWLRLTLTDLSDFEHSLSEIDGNGGILDQAGIESRWSEKGLHGYTSSAKLIIKRDNDTLTVGHLAMAETGSNQGGMIELSGVGCKLLQIQYPELWLELYSLFVHYEWRISRTDIALDLPGQYCLDKGYTVPVLFQQAVMNGLFKSDMNRNASMKQTYSMAGDWSPLVVGGIDPQDYEPLEHCPAGLTAYIGSRKGSASFYRCYEKGKELLGAVAEPDSVDRAWIRVEEEMTRKNGRTIPLDVMLRPDEYFAINRPKARELLTEYRETLDLDQIQQAQLQQFKREKTLSVAKKVYWAKHSYGRLFRTLVDRGIDYAEIIDWLTRSDGLKECVFDIGDDDEHDVSNDLIERGLVPVTATPDAIVTRAMMSQFQADKLAYATASGGVA